MPGRKKFEPVHYPEDTRENYRELVEQLGGVRAVHDLLGISYATLWDRTNNRNGRGKLTREMFIALRTLCDVPHTQKRPFGRWVVLELFKGKTARPLYWVSNRLHLMGWSVTHRAVQMTLSRLVEDGHLLRVQRGVYQRVPNKTCTVSNCRNKMRARGLCKTHYEMYRDAGMLGHFPSVREAQNAQEDPQIHTG